LGTIAWKLDQYEKQVVHVDNSDLATEVWKEILYLKETEVKRKIETLRT
jgi:hypothetical protein